MIQVNKKHKIIADILQRSSIYSNAKKGQSFVARISCALVSALMFLCKIFSVKIDTKGLYLRCFVVTADMTHLKVKRLKVYILYTATCKETRTAAVTLNSAKWRTDQH